MSAHASYRRDGRGSASAELVVATPLLMLLDSRGHSVRALAARDTHCRGGRGTGSRGRSGRGWNRDHWPDRGRRRSETTGRVIRFACRDRSNRRHDHGHRHRRSAIGTAVCSPPRAGGRERAERAFPSTGVEPVTFRPDAETGGVAAELVIVTPLLILFLLFVVALGRLAGSRIDLDGAANQAAACSLDCPRSRRRDKRGADDRVCCARGRATSVARTSL